MNQRYAVLNRRDGMYNMQYAEVDKQGGAKYLSSGLMDKSTVTSLNSGRNNWEFRAFPCVIIEGLSLSDLLSKFDSTSATCQGWHAL